MIFQTSVTGIFYEINTSFIILISGSKSVKFAQKFLIFLKFLTFEGNTASVVVASLDKMLHDDYLCLVESGKQQIKEVRRKFNRKTWKQRQLISKSGFVLSIAPSLLSRD